MTNRTRRIAVLALALAAVAGAPAIAAADVKVTCDALEISATSGTEGKIAPELKPLEKKLKKKPFSSWNTFTLLSKTSKELERLKDEDFKLTKGKATVLFRDLDKGTKKNRIALTVTTEDENGKRIADTKVNIDAGDYIVLARTLSNDDGHLLAVTCK